MTDTTPDLPPAPPAPRAWADPVCTEYRVGDLTAFSSAGVDDSFGLS